MAAGSDRGGGAEGRLGIGIVGCGRVAGLRHVPALEHVEEAAVVALSDTDPARLAALGERSGVARRFADYRELIADPAVAAVAVCVPVSSHFEVAAAALEAGKHVFVEKPLALDLDDADRLIELAAGSGRTATVGYNLRHHRLACAARDLVAGGALGEIRLVRTAFTSPFALKDQVQPWRARRALGGGVLGEVAGHHFDLCRFLLADELVDVTAATQSDDLDDQTAVVGARTAGGALVSLVFSQLTQGENGVQIMGSDAALRLDLYRFDGLELSPVTAYRGGLGSRARELGRTLRAFPAGLAQSRSGGDYLDSYRREWRHFAAAVRGEVAPDPTLEDGRRAVELLLAASASAALDRTVAVADAPRRLADAVSPAR